MNLDEIEAQWRRKANRADAIATGFAWLLLAVTFIAYPFVKWEYHKAMVRAVLEEERREAQ